MNEICYDADADAHARARRTGHLWQGRFGAVAMDEDHLANAMRYVSNAPKTP